MKGYVAYYSSPYDYGVVLGTPINVDLGEEHEWHTVETTFNVARDTLAKYISSKKVDLQKAVDQVRLLRASEVGFG